MENQDWHKRTFAASSKEQAKKADRLGPKGKRTGYGSITWPYVNVAPPAYGMNPGYPFVTDEERGKPVSPP